MAASIRRRDLHIPYYGLPTFDRDYVYRRLVIGLGSGDPSPNPNNFGGMAGRNFDADIAKLKRVLDKIKQIFSDIVAHCQQTLADELRTALNDIFGAVFSARLFDLRIDQAKDYIEVNSSDLVFLMELSDRGLLGIELDMKINVLNWLYERYLQFRDRAGKALDKYLDPVIEGINSILRSLGIVPGADAAAEIKDHFHAAYKLASATIEES